MRKDMAQVLVERPRVNPRWETPKGRRAGRPEDELPFQEGMKVQKGGGKQLNENLAPLRRFLEKQEGRPWNKVFSELNEFIKPGNTVQEHVLTHVDDFVKRKVRVVPATERCVTGLMIAPTREFRSIYPVQVGELYVDPKDGIIKRAKAKVHFPKQRQTPRALILVERGWMAAQHQGLWYAVKQDVFAIETYEVVDRLELPFTKKGKSYPITRTKYRFVIDGERRDVISDHFFGIVGADDVLKLARLYGVKHVFGRAGTARKLNTKELKKLNLRDEVAA